MTVEAAAIARTRLAKRLAMLACAASLTACSASPEKSFKDVHALISQRTGQSPHWVRNTDGRRVVRDEVRKILSQPLTIAGAVRVALLHNPQLQARYEQLGVAQADLLQAGMLSNPTLGLAARLPTTGTPGLNLDADLSFNFLTIFTRAARTKVAETALEQTKLSIASEVIMLEAQVRRAYVQQQAAQQQAALCKLIAEAAQAAFDNATGLHSAGNINELRLAQEQALYETARLNLLDAQTEMLATRERLNRLLGLWGPQTEWKLERQLRELPRDEVVLHGLEKRAIEQRFDLQAAKARSLALAKQLGIADDFGWLAGAELGVSLERELDGLLLLGPSGTLPLPLFDQGQARVARAAAELRASYGDVSTLAVEIRAQVRLARNALIRARRRAEHFRDVVIPLRERIVQLTLQQYNFMLVGVFQLLEQKQRESQAYRNYIAAVRDYWIAYFDLTNAVGGRLPAPDSTAPDPAASDPAASDPASP